MIPQAWMYSSVVAVSVLDTGSGGDNDRASVWISWIRSKDDVKSGAFREFWSLSVVKLRAEL